MFASYACERKSVRARAALFKLWALILMSSIGRAVRTISAVTALYCLRCGWSRPDAA